MINLPDHEMFVNGTHNFWYIVFNFRWSTLWPNMKWYASQNKYRPPLRKAVLKDPLHSVHTKKILKMCMEPHFYDDTPMLSSSSRTHTHTPNRIRNIISEQLSRRSYRKCPKTLSNSSWEYPRSHVSICFENLVSFFI